MSLSVPLAEFRPFPRLPRLSREVICTEKIDGTNALVFVSEDGLHLLAGSRNRWITPDDDNYGFAGWVQAHREELLLLGPGHHFGEWWGAGIQRRYDQTEKRFSLFNVARWGKESPPACCRVVPVLYTGPFETDLINGVLMNLRATGSVAAPGFMKPEGIVIFHTAARCLFKKTIEHDATGKPE